MMLKSSLVNISDCGQLGDEYGSSLTSNCSSISVKVNEEVVLEFPSTIRNMTTVILSIILAVGATGNILIPIVVCRTKELRNSTNIFLMNLSVADLLVLLVCTPPILIELHTKPEVWLLGENMCKIVPFVELSVAHGSVLTILAISFERYYAICQPLKAGYTCTKMRAIVIIIIVWVVALLITSPILLFSQFTYTEYVDGSTVPVCLTLVQSLWQRLYFISMIVGFFGIPFIILITVYAIITKHLIIDSQVISSSSEQLQMKARRQVVLMLVAVVLSFFLCLLPFRIFTLWIISVDPQEIQDLGMELYYTLLYFCRILLYTNSATNPILYNVISSKFRDAFLRVIGWKTEHRIFRRVTFTPTSLTLHSSFKSRSSHSSNMYASTRTFVAKELNNML
ncbi:growth hormone secretagogue receptor type 1-like [Tachypleus tridentatus]|uniref:growth hormone secretagogue receptor type 1-like n=1 Tax=Tachypleus tridentatus TaxID=6853 RepID=UPI003FCFFD28